MNIRNTRRSLTVLGVGLLLGALLPGSRVAQAQGQAQSSEAVRVDPAIRAMLPQDVRDKGVLTAATSASVPPLFYIDAASNTIVGALADLTHAYAARLGITIQLVKTSGDAVIPGVLANRYDIVAAMGDFISRRDKIDSIDVVKGGNALVITKGNPARVAGLNDLCGRKLAVGKGGIQEKRAGEISEACGKAGRPPVQILPFADGPTAMLALQSGRVDAHWDDLASAVYKVSKNPAGFAIAGTPQDKDAPYGVGFPKNRVQVRDAVQAALTSLHKDGTYAKILAKWGVSEIALPAIVINGSTY